MDVECLKIEIESCTSFKGEDQKKVVLKLQQELQNDLDSWVEGDYEAWAEKIKTYANKYDETTNLYIE